MATQDVHLYDATGQLVPLSGAIEAAPQFRVTPLGVERTARDRYRENRRGQATPAYINSILERCDAGDPYDWILLAEEVIEKNAKIGSVLQTRTAAVQGLYYEVQPAILDDDASQIDRDHADEIAKFCELALARANFHELTGDMMDAVGMPYSIDWIEWGLTEPGGLLPPGKAVPQKFRKIPSTHLRWEWDSDEILVFDPNDSKPRDSRGKIGRPLPPYTTVRSIFNTRRGHPLRSGLMRTYIWLDCFQNISFKDWVIYNERYGMPFRLGKIPDSMFDDLELVEKIRVNLIELGSGGTGVVTTSTEIETMPGSSGGEGAGFENLIEYINKMIAQVGLGHELSSQSSPGPGQLGITAAEHVRQDILESDCHIVSGIVKRDILTPIVGWNFGWDEVDRGFVPELTYNYEPPRDLNATAGYIQTLAKTFSDLPFSRSQIRDEFGLDAPFGEDEDPESDVLMPTKAPAPVMPGQQDGGGDGAPPDGEDDAEPKQPKPPIMGALAQARRRRIGNGRRRGQRQVDRLARKGIEKGLSVSTAWTRQLRALLREAQQDGISLTEVARRLIKAYPELDAASLERTLREQSLLSKLFGRNG